MKKVFLDTETTGLAPGKIAQLSMIIEDDNGEIIAKNYFFKIDYITDDAENICGRGIEFYENASGGKEFKDYKDEILKELSDSTLIAHNLNFDENFISTEFWRLGVTFKPQERFDTMKYFRDICKIPCKYSKYKNPSLDELINYFNIDKNKIRMYSVELFGNSDYTNTGLHDARYDTTALFVVFQIYKESLYNKDNWKKTFTL